MTHPPSENAVLEKAPGVGGHVVRLGVVAVVDWVMAVGEVGVMVTCHQRKA